MTTTKWPTHPDGRPKKMGEMTRAEQVAQLRDACRRLQAEFDHPDVKEKIRHILNGGKVQ